MLPGYEAYDYENITIDNTAGGIGFTAAKVTPAAPTPYRAAAVEFSIDGTATNSINYTLEGTAPTADAGTALGQKAFVNDVVSIFEYNNIRQFKAIRSAGVSATLRVTYFRRIGTK